MGRAPSRAVRAACRAVVANAFPEAAPLPDVLGRIGFVQADPIRAPARAQDLILRQRVEDYRAGELEWRYPSLALEEDFVYAYGFTTRAVHELLHPRGGRRPAGLARDVLAFVREREATHPKALVAAFGAQTRVNAWGGVSRATTRALEELHYLGHLRIVRRERGIRLYGAALARETSLEPAERLRRLVLQLAHNFAPLPEASLRRMVRYLRLGAPALRGLETIVARLARDGALASAPVDGVRYVWPQGLHGVDAAPDLRPVVRFLAPFDPVVWDRRRLEMLWGWDYRFEAYTPEAKRRFGYYALPVLWEDRLVGWVNAAWQGGELQLARGWIDARPREAGFTRAFDAEVERLRSFLGGRA